MTKIDRLEHRFVKSAPRELESGILYVSFEYATVLHLCACGCGRKVVTPLSPNDWKMTFNGQTVSLHPSIGSWSLPCRSHYVVRDGRIRWAGAWSDEQIQLGREADRRRKRHQMQTVAKDDTNSASPAVERLNSGSLLSRIICWFQR
ncbi:DUF6527 family protein [Roseibium sp. HPY-6]|uniref:DUF6527 family protein n=1 Tax=Roseibium sp. HPY-6 TaxID=3229852 RepID=UPI0033905391